MSFFGAAPKMVSVLLAAHQDHAKMGGTIKQRQTQMELGVERWAHPRLGGAPSPKWDPIGFDPQPYTAEKESKRSSTTGLGLRSKAPKPDRSPEMLRFGQNIEWDP